MDAATIQRLAQLNNAFYRENHDSFSDTRRNPWPGWGRIARIIGEGPESQEVLDVACGNMRFERFLVNELPQCSLKFTCVDSCDELASQRDGVAFENVDVIARLLQGMPLVEREGFFDAAVSFGFMHHIPTLELRVAFVRELLSSVRPGGVLALSFWRFMNDERLAAKARKTTERGCEALGLILGKDDYLFGWNETPAAFRYCHYFTDEEIGEIVSSTCDAMLIDRFESDGRSGDLNGYVVLRKL